MHSVDLIANCLESELPGKTEKGICCVTGVNTDCLPRKELFGKSFTNLDLLAAPRSSLAGVNAYKALKYRPERTSSWYCNGREFRKLKRGEVRNLVIDARYDPCWIGYATTSYKKHGSLFTKINSSGKAVWRFEMKNADCSDHALLLSLWKRLNIELRAGIGRSIMESLNCPPFLLKKIGIQRWIAFEKWARPLFQGSLYKFLCYLLPSQEELRNE